MGVHIYTGSLVRFYTNNWENEIQRIARENGHSYRTKWEGEVEPKWPSPELAAQRLDDLQAAITRDLKLTPGSVLWRDDIPDYHTTKLHAEGREAIKLVAAHFQRPDLPFPARMPRNCDEDPAYMEAAAKGYLIGPIAAFDCSLIVHAPFDGVMWVRSPLGELVLTCSVEFLSAALHFVSEGFWNGETKSEEWRRRGLVFARDSGRLQFQGNVIETSWDEEPAESLKGNAEFAFGVYTDILDFACKNKTAIAIW